ncbi:MAG: hypothetical protein ABI700_03525 [Chloroflexota bacterium]
MKKFRSSIALVVLALVLAIVPAVFAQDTLGASQGDYDLWTAANASIADISTASIDFTAKLEVAGMGDTNVSADLKGTGVIDTNKDNPAFQLDVTGSVVNGKDTTPVNVGLRIVDGMLYATMDGGETWEGSKLDDAMSSFGSGFAQGSGLPVSPTDLQNGDLSSLTSNPEAEAAMKALSELKPSNFLSLVRSDAGGLAQFTLKLDVAKLLADPALMPLFAGMGGLMGGSSGGDAAPAMTDAQMQQMQAMVGMMFSTATITVDEYIDPASSQLQRANLTIALPLDNMVGPGAAVNINFDISLSKSGEPVTVEVPANVTMMTPEPSSTQ